MKKHLLLTLLIGTVLALSGCGNAGNASAKAGGDVKAEETVKIAYLPITHSLAVLEEAEELANNEKVNVELVKYGSWPELLDALNSGNVDGASVLIELAMKSKAEGVGIKAVALGHKDGNVIVVSNDVKDGADLKGRTIAIPHRQSSHNILVNDALAKNGLTIDDINVVELAPTEMPSALVTGTIDGYCVAEPFGAVGVSTGKAKVLYTSEELWEDSVCCALVLTDDFIDKKSDTAKAFVEGYKTAGNNLDADTAKAVAGKYLKQKDDVLETSLKWISYDDLDITEEQYNKLTEKVKEYGLSDNPPAYSDFVKTDF
ncbi:NitT/TauT family transport system substrate-binding protein [Butyrivibrio hungatei]|uniref:NitT/TauT family transport system substrate-binding protein n=1 Tax=Butyrivibrio hungatei TaxID=185008 RepID=A0A1G5D0J3_9FIRM|nr:ABC transporter substrate-binding protein [Butyrivibrio hungatei]SCY08205.1 NitT/TauT family transport system substrate-binding protein [Butyrivibrio hungatei]